VPGEVDQCANPVGTTRVLTYTLQAPATHTHPTTAAKRRHNAAQSVSWTGGPFKPDFGLSGAFPSLDRAYPLALARSPFGLDFNSSLAASCVMEKAAPRPLFGALLQSLLHPVPMNVMKLLYKLRMIANVEIVVALLPEMVGVSDQTPRHSLLQRLEGFG
jgi:hypothetical protein